MSEVSNPFPEAFLKAVSRQDPPVAPQPVTPNFIDNVAELQQLNAAFSQTKILGLDTEFIREKTFHPILALVQVALPEEAQQYLIDVPAFEQAQPLDALKQKLLCPTTIKVMHGCSEDIEIFMHFCGGVPTNIFDTQMAAALLGARVQTGYEGLVAGIFGGTIDKSVTRSDWLKRPLSAEQRFYAAADVTYLLPLHAVLEKALIAQGRLQWLADEYAQLVHVLENPMPLHLSYQRIGLHWRLQGKALYVLQQLCLWREQQVRRHNIPRSFLLSDTTIMAIAKAHLSSPAQLRRAEGMKPVQWRRYGSDLVEALTAIVHNAPANAGDDLPVVMPKAKKYRPLVKQLKAIIEQRARELCLETNVLLGKRYLHQFLDLAEAQFQQLGHVDVSALEGPPWVHGWRRSEILTHLSAPVSTWLKEQ